MSWNTREGIRARWSQTLYRRTKKGKLFYRTEEQIQRFFFFPSYVDKLIVVYASSKKPSLRSLWSYLLGVRVLISVGSDWTQAKVALFLRLMDIGRSPPRRHLSMEAKRVAAAFSWREEKGRCLISLHSVHPCLFPRLMRGLTPDRCCHWVERERVNGHLRDGGWRWLTDWLRDNQPTTLSANIFWRIIIEAAPNFNGSSVPHNIDNIQCAIRIFWRPPNFASARPKASICHFWRFCVAYPSAARKATSCLDNDGDGDHGSISECGHRPFFVFFFFLRQPDRRRRSRLLISRQNDESSSRDFDTGRFYLFSMALASSCTPASLFFSSLESPIKYCKREEGRIKWGLAAKSHYGRKLTDDRWRVGLIMA